MNRKLSVMFVEMNNTDLVYQHINNLGYDIIPGYSNTFDTITDYLQQHKWDVMIVMIEETSIRLDDVISKISKFKLDVPVVLVCENAGREDILRALDAGCTDVISMGELYRLEYIIHRLLSEAERENKDKAIREKLLAEKEKLEVTLGSIGDGVITVDVSEQIVMMNNGAEMITGWPFDLAMNRPLTEVFKVVEKDTEKPLDILLDLTMDSGETIGLKRDTVLISRDGDIKYVSACISPIKVSDAIIGVIIVFRDITRIRQTEEKLITEQRNLALIFDAAPIGLLLVDENAIIKKANKSMLYIVGRQEQEVINQKIGTGLGCIISCETEMGCGFSNSCGNCDLIKTLTEISSTRETMRGIETRFRLSVDNTEREYWLKINSVPITIDNKKHLMLVIDDITKMKLAEEGLRRYQLLSENANDIIMFTDINGRIIEANSAAFMSYGYTREEILGKSIFELVNPDNRSLVRTQSVKDNAEGVYYEATARKKDGTAFSVEVSLQSTVVAQSKVLLSVQRDITERKQTQRELEKAREYAEAANHTKSEFLANMSHEIRTPLNGMLGMIDLTLLTGLTKEQKDNLVVAKDCASNLLNLINDILDLSKIEAGKLKLENINFDLSEFIEQTIKPHNIKAQGKGLVLKFHLDSQIPRIVNGDPHRLKQVINNLLGNAIKFTDIGEINLLASLKDSSDEFVELEFQISDTGVGIESKNIGRIFNTFSQADNSITRKYGGSGLGLAISRQLVEMMSGTIWVESEKGKGSTFYFTTRLGVGRVMSSIRHDLEAIVKVKQPLQILLAEDDTINQVVITRMLKEAGHFIETANNGVEALQAINKKTIDVVLMDIQMPEMDGIEAVKRVRRSEKGTRRHIPIIALTAYALQGDRERYLSAGMDGYIAKPVQINTLLETIDEIAERSKIENWNEAFVGDEFNDKCENWMHKDFIVEHSKDIEKVISSISMNIVLLKDAFEKEDLSLIETYAHEIKELSLAASVNIIKNTVFKLELAIRKENLAYAAEHFIHLVEEFDKLKRQYTNNYMEI